MTISNNSKLTLQQEMERLEQKKIVLVSRIQELKEKRDSLIAQRDVIITKINELKADSV